MSSLEHHELAVFPAIAEEKPLNFHVEDKHLGVPTLGSDPSSGQSLSKLETLKAYRMAVLICLVVGYGAIMDGYCLSIPGSIVANEGFILQFGTITIKDVLQLDARYVANWTTIANTGLFGGWWLSSYVNDRFGRKPTMYLFFLFMLVANIVQIVSKEWKVYAASRALVGVSQGLMQGCVTVYISDIAPTAIRGTMLAIYSFFFALGQLICSIALQIIQVNAPLQYKLGFYSEFALLGLFIPALVWAPESPWYLVRAGKESKAKHALHRLYGSVPGYNVDAEYRSMIEIIAHEDGNSAEGLWNEFLSCFRGTNLRRTMLAFVPVGYQLLCGIGLFFGYATYFFQIAGYAKPFEASLIQSCILLLFLVVSFYTVDRFGRRLSLLLGGAIMLVCNFAVGGIGFKTELPGVALVALTCVWTAAYAVSAGAIGWIYLVEVSSPRLRALTTGIAITFAGFLNLIFSYTIPIMLSPQKANWGLKIGFLYGGLGALGLVGMYFTVVETRGRSFDQLDQMFEAKVSARKSSKFEGSLDSTNVQLGV